MVVLCPSCNSSEIIFEYECQSYCCSACGSVLDDDEINKDNNDPVNEDTEPANNATLPPLLEVSQ
jgi:transcription initiation factor TFIIIB Brf1 subunit/transcription initiation factor TFIIB